MCIFIKVLLTTRINGEVSHSSILNFKHRLLALALALANLISLDTAFLPVLFSEWFMGQCSPYPIRKSGPDLTLAYIIRSVIAV